MNTYKIYDLQQARRINRVLEYGSTIFYFDSLELEKEVRKCIFLTNEVTNSDVIRIKPYMEDILINQQYEQREVPGAYQIIYAERKPVGPDFNKYPDSLKIEEFITNCLEQKQGIKLNIPSELFGYAKKLCKLNNVKFKIFNDYQVIDGIEKKLSASKTIEEAILNDLDLVTFNFADHRPATIRCYVSALNSFYNKKMKVEVKNGVISVLLKSKTKSEILLLEMFESVVAAKGKNEAIAMLKSIIDQYEVETEAEAWDRIAKEVEERRNKEEAEGADKFEVELEEIKRIDGDLDELEYEVTQEVIDSLEVPDLSHLEIDDEF